MITSFTILLNYAVSTLLLSNYFYPSISTHKTLRHNRRDKRLLMHGTFKNAGSKPVRCRFHGCGTLAGSKPVSMAVEPLHQKRPQAHKQNLPVYLSCGLLWFRQIAEPGLCFKDQHETLLTLRLSQIRSTRDRSLDDHCHGMASCK